MAQEARVAARERRSSPNPAEGDEKLIREKSPLPSMPKPRARQGQSEGERKVQLEEGESPPSPARDSLSPKREPPSPSAIDKEE